MYVYSTLTHVTTWMKLRHITLSEIRQSQTDTLCFHLYEAPRVVKLAEIELERWLLEAEGRSNAKLVLKGYRFSYTQTTEEL